MKIPDNLTIPCPQCEAPVDVQWIEVTSWDRAVPDYLPGEIRCSANPSHDVRSAAQELDWPTSLTEEDRAWLRQHGRLTP